MKTEIQQLQQQLDNCTDFIEAAYLKDKILELKGATPQRTCNIDDDECENCGS